MKFLQPTISDSLGFSTIWSRISPSSQLGVVAKKQVTPFVKEEEEELRTELNNLELVYSKFADQRAEIEQIKDILQEVKDIRGTVKRTNRGSVLDDVELFEIKKLLDQIEKLSQIIGQLQLNEIYAGELAVFPDLIDLLDIGQNKKDSFYLADEYSEELIEIRAEKKKIDNQLLNLQQAQAEEIETLIKRPVPINEEINVSKNDEELIEKLESKPQISLVRENFATVTFKLKSNQQILELKEEKKKLKTKEEICKQKVRRKLTEQIGCQAEELLANLEKIGYLDLLIAKAEFAYETDSVRPQLIQKDKIEIKAGRHLVVEEELAAENLEFTPIDVRLKQGSTLITGPNMGGKTVSLKLIGLLIVMAQYGLFIPAASLQFSLRNFVYFSVTSDTLASGLSTFGTEINNLKEVVAVASQSGLILIDEVAHGTNPKEGYAIAAAIIEKLETMNSMSAFTTHFERLAVNLNVRHLQVKGLDEAKLTEFKDLIKQQGVKLLNKCMDYELQPADPEQDIPHDALQVAEILGFDEEILSTAQEILTSEFESKEE